MVSKVSMNNDVTKLGSQPCRLTSRSARETLSENSAMEKRVIQLG